MKHNNLFGYEVQFSKRAQKQLASVSKKFRDKILDKLSELVSRENHSLNLKRVVKFDNLYRIKYGAYRIVYEPLHRIVVVHVVLVGLRKNIYKCLDKLF